jgi:hypothetical protein
MKRKETLKEGLNREADKKGLSGKERHRYIGGAITNMEKRGAIKKVERKAPPRKPRERLELTVKKNSAASKARSYDVYSLYRANGTQYGDATYRTRKGATNAKNSAEAAHNHPKGVHTQKQFRI